MKETDTTVTWTDVRKALLVPVWGIFLIFLTGALLYARTFFMPIVLAFLLSLVFSPLRRTLEKAGIPSTLAAVILVFSLITAVTATVLSVAVPATKWVDDAPQIMQKVEAQFAQLKPAAEKIAEIDKGIGNMMDGDAEPGDPQSQPARSAGADETTDINGDGKGDTIVVQQEKSGSMLVELAASAPIVLAQFVFTMILLMFLLASGDLFLEKSVHVAPTRAEKKRVVQIVLDIERRLSKYLLTITLINAGLGVAIGFAMWMLGMPNPILFGVIGFLFNYVPYVGALAGTAIAFAVAIVSIGTLGAGFTAAAVYFALTSVEGQIITPWLVGRNLRLNTVVVFISVMFWAWLWSVVGMLVALPLLVALRVFCQHIPALEPLAEFLSDSRAKAGQGIIKLERSRVEEESV